MNDYVPLNIRSAYSIGDSICQIPRLVRKARELTLPAMALVDTNLCGTVEFHKACRSTRLDYGGLPVLKPIIGLSVWIKERGVDAPLVLLAKNKDGYHNLVRLASENAVLGRVGELVVPLDSVLKATKGVICLAGSADLDLAEECFSAFCGDFAFMAENDDEVFPDWKIVTVCAMPPVRFLDKDDAEAYDAYCALNDCRRMDAPDARRCNGNEYLLTKAEISAMFRQHPEWVENTRRLAAEIEYYDLDEPQDVVEFPIPAEFHSGMEYLRHLVAEGAAKRWGRPLPKEVSERIEFELSTIEHSCAPCRCMDFASYFLVVQDYVAAARRMEVWVGPGRGSVAGSAVAYSLGITNVDPIKQGLLFERFLTPDKISMPDIDIDFEDCGREKVLQYVTGKYGRDHVAHIVSFGQMATRSAIKDVSRVVGMSVADAKRLAELVPEMSRITFDRAYKQSKWLRNARENGNDLEKKVLRIAEKLEGCVLRQGIHPCGIVISRKPLSEVAPVMSREQRELGGVGLVTQYDEHSVEPIGLVKFDILGLQTLGDQKNCINLIKERKGLTIDLDKIPYDEPETMEIFASGDTGHIFQFESDGMKRWLKELKPKCLDDLVAMNALYRPGLLEYVPAFVRRKNGEETVTYDHPLMEEDLRETYGVTVYQEQMMILSQSLADFTRVESDKLRKALGKRRLDVMEELKTKFIKGCLTNRSFRVGKWKDEGEARSLIDKIWNDWRAFASYAFNKSHAVCSAWLAYQTAYLKAHYPAEFMLGMMESEYANGWKIRDLIDEARSKGIRAYAPVDCHKMDWRNLVKPGGLTVLEMPSDDDAWRGVLHGVYEWAKERNGTKFAVYYSLRKPREVIAKEAAADGRYLIFNDTSVTVNKMCDEVDDLNAMIGRCWNKHVKSRKHFVRVGLVIVDCLQLVETEGDKSTNGADEEASILYRLAQMAYERCLQVVVLSLKSR